MNKKNTDCNPVNSKVIESARQEMPGEGTLLRLACFFKMMGDGTRLKILWALDHSEMCVADLSVLLNMTKSAVSHQLCELRSANLVRARREGRHVFYSLEDDHVKLVVEMAVDHVMEHEEPPVCKG